MIENRRILLIDDDPAIYDLVRAYVCDSIEIVHARSGREGLEKTAWERFDAVVLDAVIPDINGERVSREIRNRFESTALPILVVSAFFKRNRDQRELLDLWKVQGFLRKPFSREEFAQAARHAFGFELSNPSDEALTVVDLREEYLDHVRGMIDAWLRRMDEREQGQDGRLLIADLESGGHQLRGSAGAYGFPEMGAAAEQIESLARNCLRNEASMSALEWGRFRFLAGSIRRTIDRQRKVKQEISSGDGKTWLYAGTDAIFRRQLTIEARSCCRTLVAAGAQTEVIQNLRNETICLAMVDLDTFDVGAESIVAAVRDLSGPGALPVVCVSTEDSTAARLAASRVGADSFRLKRESMGWLRDVSASKSTSGAKTLLAVDDDRFSLDYLKRVVESPEWSVHTLDGPSGFLEAVKARRPDVILMDFEMPEAKGSELCAILKMDAATKMIPVIIVTAHEDENVRIMALKAGAVGCLKKWPSVPELKLMLNNLGGRTIAPETPAWVPAAQSA